MGQLMDINDGSFHDLKNEMIYFNVQSMQITKEQLTKMQLLSIQITMKHLKLQKCANQNNLNHLNSEILSKLKNVPTQRKKLLKNRISSLDGSIYNLETTLHSMEDMKINKMVFAEMQNADKMLKCMIQSTPSIDALHGMREDLNKSMQINEEIGDVLSAPMDVNCDNDDDDELLKEYNELENTKQMLPNAPNHDIVIKDKHGVDNDDDVDT